MTQYRVCLDAGHGGHDPGAVGNGLQEKNLNLTICNLVRDYLKQYQEIYVFRTRGDDGWVSLRTRCGIANENKADLFISFHSNAGGGSGFESYVCPGSHRSAVAQRIIHQEAYRFMQDYGVKENLAMTIPRDDFQAAKQLDLDAFTADVDDRGQQVARFYVLLHTDMPAILVETLFVDHVEDAELLKNEKFLDGVARNYADGIVKFFGLALSGDQDDLRHKVDLLEQQLGDCQGKYEQLKNTYDGAREDLKVIAQRSSKYVKREGL